MNLIVFNLDTTADIDVDRSVIYVLREFVKYNIESELKIKVLYSNHALEMHENDFSKITASDYDMIRRQMENVSVGLFLSGCINNVAVAHVYYNPCEKKGVIRLIKNRGSNHELLQRKEWLKVAIIDLPQESMIKQDIQDFLDIWDRDDRDEVLDD